ncbi:MAG TPA: phosphopantothenoylcysteine decarboxylase, partial [Actinomycetota bacterium]|nr:phosphopantothenoylcysteine decarboxylase [Actinomycetota bacterium]
SATAAAMTTAVADWRPTSAVSGKMKKEDGPPSLVLEPTTDILSALGKKKERQVLVGFAAETGDLESEGRRKLGEKNLDFIVVNEVGRAGTGFGSETDRAAILSREESDVAPRIWTKQELAAAICDRLVSLLSGQTRHI